MSLVIALAISFGVFFLMQARSPAQVKVKTRSNSIPQRIPLDDRSW